MKYESKNLENIKGRMAKRVGGKAFLVPRLGIQRIKNAWKRTRQKAHDFAVNAAEEKKDKIDFEINEWARDRKALYREVKKHPDSREAEAALSYTKAKIASLREKKVKINKKGLGVFALSAVAVKKITTKGIHKAQEGLHRAKESIISAKDQVKNDFAQIKQDFREHREERRREKEIRITRRQYEQIMEKMDYLQSIQKERKEIRERQDREYAEEMNRLQSMHNEREEIRKRQDEEYENEMARLRNSVYSLGFMPSDYEYREPEVGRSPAM